MFGKGNSIYTEFDHNGNKKISIADNSIFRFNIASFSNEKQMKKFLKKIGVKDVYRNVYSGYESRGTDYDIEDHDVSFWNKKEVPRGAKKIKALSNGSIVDCYFVKDKKNKIIEIYRPNPNAKKVYRPLSTEKHIKYQIKHGVY